MGKNNTTIKSCSVFFCRFNQPPPRKIPGVNAVCSFQEIEIIRNGICSKQEMVAADKAVIKKSKDCTRCIDGQIYYTSFYAQDTVLNRSCPDCVGIPNPNKEKKIEGPKIAK